MPDGALSLLAGVKGPAGFLAAAALTLASCSGGAEEAATRQAEATPQQETACKTAIFEEVPLTLCIADPRLHRIHMALAPEQGAPYRSLAAYAASLRTAPRPVVFVMNAGMFDDDGEPIGYYVENGQRLKPLNQARGPGNFHMSPNGVFFGIGGKWEIRTSEDFLREVKERPEFGTQSGPMLVIDGELHPDIAADGESLRIRNGVGIDAQGRALFAISDEPISFGKFARFFRDELAARNALFLDGTVSALWAPANRRLDQGFPIGPLIVVEKRAKASAEKAPQ